MQYQVTKRCVIDRQPRGLGDVVEVSAEEAKELMATGRIVPVDKPAATADRNAGAAPKKRGRPRKKVD